MKYFAEIDFSGHIKKIGLLERGPYAVGQYGFFYDKNSSDLVEGSIKSIAEYLGDKVFLSVQCDHGIRIVRVK